MHNGAQNSIGRRRKEIMKRTLAARWARGMDIVGLWRKHRYRYWYWTGVYIHFG